MANIQRNIIINAKSNGFGAVGNTLLELGAEIDQVSQKLINFGKESIDVYKDYEQAMSEAEVALSTKYGRNTEELSKVMKQLDESATNWAASTIFHTDDVANAINQAAHAGWDLDEILNGIPAAMELAQAGSIDLSDAMYYIVKSMKAFDVPYDELGDFIDMWVYAANSSAGDVQDFGDAMLKMGSTMRFTDSKEELLSLIGLMHDMGETGSTAATLLRTSMMRIIAPSGVTTAVLEQLGATDEELQAIREDASKVQALATLESYGFTAFKDDGQAKPILEIYADLGTVLAEIAGGYENINKNQTTAGILGTIFGTKGITGALDIVNGLQSAVELRDKLLAGDATGYGEYASETMMDTLYGSIETFESKVERLKQVVGEELAPQLKSVQGFFGDIVDSLATMDSGNLSALVSGLEVIAGAGAGLTLAGLGFKAIAYALTPAGGIGLGLVALTAAAVAIKDIEESNFAENFGDMDLNTTDIQNYVKTLGEDFRTAHGHVKEFADALDLSVENYKTASTTFSSTLFTDMITNAKLTPEDKTVLETLGNDMFLAVQGAIGSSMSKSSAYWKQLFGGEGVAEYDPAYQDILLATNEAYEAAKAEAEAIGKGLKDALTAAWDGDNEISPEEYQNILSYMQSYNEAIAKAAAEAQQTEQQVQFQKNLKKAQTASLEEIRKLSETAEDERTAQLETAEDAFLDSYVRAEMAGADEKSLARAKELHEQEIGRINAQYDEYLLTLWDSQMRQSGQADNYTLLQQYAQQYMSGEASAEDLNTLIRETMGASAYAGDAWGNTTSNRAQLGRLMGYMIGSLGGNEGVEGQIAYYDSTGNTAMATRLRQLYAMEQLINNFGVSSTLDEIPWDILNLAADYVNSNQSDPGGFSLPKQMNRDSANAAIFGSAEIAQTYQDLRTLRQQQASLEAEITEAETWAGKATVRSDGSIVSNDIFGRDVAAYTKLYGSYAFGQYQGGGLYDQKAQVDADIEQAEAKLEELKETAEEETEMPLAMDTEQADKDIEGLDENIAQERFMPVTAELDSSAVDEYEPEDKYATVYYSAEITGDTGEGADTGETGKSPDKYAEGGRATEASIFGEAGPEWAIPEEHSQRTAELLNAAREASGFTWPDILGRFGGMNANAANSPATIVYSPTINAQDATGVEQILREDKKRLEEWFESKKLHDEMEVYA